MYHAYCGYSAYLPEGETAEQTVDAIVAILEIAKDRLLRFQKIFKELYPILECTIPDPSEINIGKLGNRGAVTTDTCSAARKTKRLLSEIIIEKTKKLNNQNPVTMDIDC